MTERADGEASTRHTRRGFLAAVGVTSVAGLAQAAPAAPGADYLLAPGLTYLNTASLGGLLYVSADAPGIELVQWENGRRFVANSVGIGSLPLAVGLGVAIDTLRARGLAAVERHNLALRDRAYAGLAAIRGLEVVGPPPGPLATALVAARLPAAVDSALVRNALREKHGIMIKMVEKRWFNGIRLSPHLFNTDADIDAALRALRTELA